MAQATTLPFSAFKVMLETGTTGTFAAPCGLTERSVTFSKETNDTTSIDCDDEDAPAWVDRDVVSMSATGAVQSVPLDWNEDLKIGWCTPWRLEARHDPDGYLEANGWRIRWNSTSLFLDNFQRYGIRVRWAVVEF